MTKAAYRRSYIVRPHIVSRISYIESQIPLFVAGILFSVLELAVYDIRNTIYDIRISRQRSLLGTS